jgi:hypothetical protein
MSAICILGVVLMWCSALLAADSTLATESARVRYLGLHIHNADTGTKWPTPSFGGWRLWDANVAWPNLEPERGRWDFAKLDRYVAMAELTGVEVLLPLGLSPNWASARPSERSSYALGNAAEPRDVEDWNNYVRVVATRYKGRIRDFEIWNEPNETGFFSGSPEMLVALTCHAQRVLKSVSRENRLVSPSMVGLANAPELLGAFLEKGGKNCIDIVGFHFYVPKGPPEALLPLVRRVRIAMQKSGVGQLPLWNTETGWWIKYEGLQLAKPDPEWLTRISVAKSGAWVARSLILGRAAELERFYWYAWDNKEMGLIDPIDGSYRTGADSFLSISMWLADSPDIICTTKQTSWLCSLKRPGTYSTKIQEVIVWDTEKLDGRFQVPTGTRVVAIDYLDRRRTLAADIQAMRFVEISDIPIKITLSNFEASSSVGK